LSHSERVAAFCQPFWINGL